MLCQIDKLGEIIKDARLKRGLTRDQLSEQVGISSRYLMSIEHEGKKPSYDVLFQLVHKLALNTNDIFYPNTNDNSELDRKHLEQLLQLCNDYEIAVITSTVQALLDKK